MSSIIIPKEQQTAYERWELSSLGDQGHRIRSTREKKSSELGETLAQITDAVRQEGYQLGLKKGFEEGSSHARLEHEVNQQAITHIADSMHKIVDLHQQQVTEDLLNLALDIAKSMIKNRLEVDRNAIVPVIEEAIQSLPYIQKPARIIVNPSDASVIRQALADTINGTWTVVENMEIERGGCLLETGANQVDATNATRWKRINDALSQDKDWMTHD
jgi:flagellar assembly protein FliH